METEWQDCRLVDACSSIDYGLTASAADHEIGPKFLRITDIVNGHIDWKSVPHVLAEGDTAAKYKLDDGDIVLARTGASTGASAYVQAPPLAVFASYLVRLQAKPEFDPRFLAYYLKSDQFLSYIRGVIGDKSAQPNASASTMTKAPLHAPRDKNEQRAIAHILGTLDDKIELNRRMNATLEAMARALFKDWFVDFGPVRAKMEGREPYLPEEIWRLFPERLMESELGEIPEGWNILAFRDLALQGKGSVNPSSHPDDVFTHYSLPAFDAGQTPAFERGEAIKSNKTPVPNNAVLVSKLNPHIPRIWLIGAAGENAVASTEFTVWTPRNPANSAFLYCLASSAEFNCAMRQLVTGTSNSHQRVKPGQLGDIRVIAASLESVQQGSEQLRRLVDQVLLNRKQASTLISLRNTLLPKIISGDLRVPEAIQTIEEISA